MTQQRKNFFSNVCQFNDTANNLLAVSQIQNIILFGSESEYIKFEKFGCFCKENYATG